jgi:hypothetical protein
VVSGIAVGMLLGAAGGNVTALIRMAPQDPIAEVAQQIEQEFFFVPAGHYDGVYYYAIAIDPFATGRANELLDLAAHRYGHPAYGWLGWLFSLGNPDWVPQALLIVSLLGMAVAAFFASLSAQRLGASAWGGLVVALNPGLIFAVTTDTSEAASAALLSIALYLWLKGARTAAGGLLIPLCFFKFQLILVPVALGLWEVVLYLRGRRDRDTPNIVGLLALGPVLFIVWMIYLRQQLGELPISGGPEFLSLPFVGFLDTMRDLAQIHLMSPENVQIASAELPIVACLVVLITIAVVRSLRFRHPLDAVFALQGAFLLLLNWWNLFYPKDMLRSMAIPIPLLIAVLYLGRQTVTSENDVAPAP